MPVSTPFLGASDFFAQNKTPFIGWGIASGFCENPFGFGFSGCLTPEDPKTASSTWGDIDQEGELRRRYEGQDRGGDRRRQRLRRCGIKTISASAKAGGFKVVYSKNPVPPPPATVSDYTPYANEIMSSNNGNPPDVVFLTVAAINVTGLQNKPLEPRLPGRAHERGATTLAAIGSTWGRASVFIQFNALESAQQGNTAMQQIIDEVRAVKPDQLLTQPVLAGYLSADMFVQMLKKTGWNLTEKRFLQAANELQVRAEGRGRVDQLPGRARAGRTCGTLVVSEGTTYEIRVPFSCYKRVKVG